VKPAILLGTGTGVVMARFFLLAVGLITASIIQAACSADTTTNANTNANMATPRAAATATPTPGTGRGDYTEKQAAEERERAKESKETIGDTLDDAWIHTKIVAKLIADSDTPERNINVDVVNNVVTLRGTVDTTQAKTDAEKIAKETDGVKSVVNQLKVAPAAKKTGKAKT
jgi:hyperosmotically inducible periplasmic protein